MKNAIETIQRDVNQEGVYSTGLEYERRKNYRYVKMSLEEYDFMGSEIRNLKEQLENSVDKFAVQDNFYLGYSFYTRDEVVEEMSTCYKSHIKRLESEQINLNWFGKFLGKLIIK